jgi:hypothetical protein
MRAATSKRKLKNSYRRFVPQGNEDSAMSSQPPITAPGPGFMVEKLLTFLFAGILGTMLYHLVTAMLFRNFFAQSPAALTYWYVPLVVLPALLLLALAWALGFGRRGSNWTGNLAVLATTFGIVFFTVGAPYNCWKQFCF